MTSPEAAFNLLANVFTTKDSVLEIEIIPSTLGSPFLQDGNSIGITKKALVGAFTVARSLFIPRLKPNSPDDTSINHGSDDAELEIPSTMILTAIMLLFDCEHLTACNWRKNMLLKAIIDWRQGPTSSPLALEELLQSELRLLQTFQCSPLHRHTKSPTLWSHRLWVLNALIGTREQSTVTLTKLERTELDIVLRAGELHPKNYYAFTYMRNLYSDITRAIEGLSYTRKSHGSVTGLIYPTLDWCLSHPRDISGWMFAIYLLDQSGDANACAGAVGRVLRFALDVGWDGESLWTFVDQAARRFGLETVLDEVFGRSSEEVSLESRMSSKWPWRNRLARAQAFWATAGANLEDGPG